MQLPNDPGIGRVFAESSQLVRRGAVQEFREFLLRGNLVDLAVAVVMGVAFTALVEAFVSSFVTPLIAAIGGKTDFSQMHFTLNDSRFFYGRFIDELISFLLTAAVLFFLVVKPINALLHRAQLAQTSEDPTTKKCPECQSEIALQARRCAFCTSELAAAT